MKKSVTKIFQMRKVMLIFDLYVYFWFEVLDIPFYRIFNKRDTGIEIFLENLNNIINYDSINLGIEIANSCRVW